MSFTVKEAYEARRLVESMARMVVQPAASYSSTQLRQDIACLQKFIRKVADMAGDAVTPVKLTLTSCKEEPTDGNR